MSINMICWKVQFSGENLNQIIKTWQKGKVTFKIRIQGFEFSRDFGRISIGVVKNLRGTHTRFLTNFTLLCQFALLFPAYSSPYCPKELVLKNFFFFFRIQQLYSPRIYKLLLSVPISSNQKLEYWLSFSKQKEGHFLSLV